MRHFLWPLLTVFALLVTAPGLAQSPHPSAADVWWTSEESASGKPVTLPDSFFHAGSSGGVERPTPLYTYRGLVLIAADGRTWTGLDPVATRLDYRRAMDARYRADERERRRQRHSRR